MLEANAGRADKPRMFPPGAGSRTRAASTRAPSSPPRRTRRATWSARWPASASTSSRFAFKRDAGARPEDHAGDAYRRREMRTAVVKEALCTRPCSPSTPAAARPRPSLSGCPWTTTSRSRRRHPPSRTTRTSPSTPTYPAIHPPVPAPRRESRDAAFETLEAGPYCRLGTAGYESGDERQECLHRDGFLSVRHALLLLT